MMSNSLQFHFWNLFNYVYSLNKPETINEIKNNLTSMDENYVFCNYEKGLYNITILI